MKKSGLAFGARVGRVLSADRNHGRAKHRRFVHAIKGSRVDDGKMGVKESPVIVKILPRWIGVCELVHTEWLLWEQDQLFLIISLCHRFGSIRSVPRNRVSTRHHWNACHGKCTGMHVCKIARCSALVARGPRICHCRRRRSWRSGGKSPRLFNARCVGRWSASAAHSRTIWGIREYVAVVSAGHRRMVRTPSRGGDGDWRLAEWIMPGNTATFYLDGNRYGEAANILMCVFCGTRCTC